MMSWEFAGFKTFNRYVLFTASKGYRHTCFPFFDLKRAFWYDYPNFTFFELWDGSTPTIFISKLALEKTFRRLAESPVSTLSVGPENVFTTANGKYRKSFPIEPRESSLVTLLRHLAYK